MFTAASKEQPGIPLPAAVAAVWGGFLYEGLLCSSTDELWADRVLEVWGQGCIELMIDTSIHLQEVWQQICTHWETDESDFPGVFEYEVVSPLGRYLADHILDTNGRLPDATAIREKVRELITEFFQSGPEVGELVLSPAVSPLGGAVTRNGLRAVQRVFPHTPVALPPPDPDQVYQELVQLGVETIFPPRNDGGEEVGSPEV